MNEYPNLEATAQDGISGQVADWSLLPKEAHLALEELKRLKKIVGCVVRSCSHIDDTSPRDEPGPMSGPTWGKVAHICGLGSRSAIALCIEHDIGPHYDCGHEAGEAAKGENE